MTLQKGKITYYVSVLQAGDKSLGFGLFRIEIIPVQCNTFLIEGDWFRKMIFFVIGAIKCIRTCAVYLTFFLAK